MKTTQARMVVCFTGASYMFAGLSFSYVHRYAGTFGVESLLWGLWALLGFGGALWHVGRGPQAGEHQWKWQAAVGLTLAVFPFFFMFNLVRWVALVLMLMMGARAAIMHTRRDLYLTLVVIFVVSFLVATHAGADWTLWFYLGPCWLFAAMALAWEHAAGARLPTSAKGLLTAGFVMLSLAVALLLHAVVPTPHITGFGFLPPGTDQHGHFTTPATAAGIAHGPERNADPTQGPASDEDSGTVGYGSGLASWSGKLQSLRQALKDPHIPPWQRATLDTSIDALQALANSLASASAAVLAHLGSLSLAGLLLWLLSLLVALWVWRRRWLLGARTALLASGGLAPWRPATSMRLSAAAATWALRAHGHRPRPGQSIREHWSSLADAPMLSEWLQRAADIYCASRFGSQGFTPTQARDLNRAVDQVCSVLWAATRAPKTA